MPELTFENDPAEYTYKSRWSDKRIEINAVEMGSALALLIIDDKDIGNRDAMIKSVRKVARNLPAEMPDDAIFALGYWVEKEYSKLGKDTNAPQT